MITTISPHDLALESRARQSLGRSNAAIYRMVTHCLETRHPGAGILVDVGCGAGSLWPYVHHLFARYIGVDAARYAGFPAEAEFHQGDLNATLGLLPDHHADVVTAVETIEHLENPRAFVRELARLTKPGGWIVVSTPNQLSLLSLTTLLVKHRFSAFQDIHYPAHLTALLEIDLRRIAHECGLQDISIAFSQQGRLVLTPYHYPYMLSRCFPRTLSDNLVMAGRTPRV